MHRQSESRKFYFGQEGPRTKARRRKNSIHFRCKEDSINRMIKERMLREKAVGMVDCPGIINVNAAILGHQLPESE